MKNRLSILMIFIFSMFLTGCDKDIEFVNTPDNNDTKAPKADAGKDQRIKVSNSKEIIGKVTAGDGEIVGYEWKEGTTLLSGLKQFTYTAPSKVGAHKLTFTVYDDNDKNGSDEMTITVYDNNSSDA